MRSLVLIYLFAYVACAKLYLGSLALVCFHPWVKEARWIGPLLPPARAALRLNCVLAPGFALLAVAAPLLYPAAGATGFRAVYSGEGAFVSRGIAYFAFWFLLGRAAEKESAWARGPGLALLVVTVTFAAIDWVMALDPKLGSTAFGLVFFLSAALSAFALAAFAAAPHSAPEQRQDQGSVHLALLCTFIYVAFMQFLVVWSGNLPREARWYADRSGAGWVLVPAALCALQFFVPFGALLQKPLKRSLAVSRALAALTLSQQLLFTAWEVLPAELPFLAGLALTGAALLLALGRGREAYARA